MIQLSDKKIKKKNLLFFISEIILISIVILNAITFFLNYTIPNELSMPLYFKTMIIVVISGGFILYKLMVNSHLVNKYFKDKLNEFLEDRTARILKDITFGYFNSDIRKHYPVKSLLLNANTANNIIHSIIIILLIVFGYQPLSLIFLSTLFIASYDLEFDKSSRSFITNKYFQYKLFKILNIHIRKDYNAIFSFSKDFDKLRDLVTSKYSYLKFSNTDITELKNILNLNGEFILFNKDAQTVISTQYIKLEEFINNFNKEFKFTYNKIENLSFATADKEVEELKTLIYNLNLFIMNIKDILQLEFKKVEENLPDKKFTVQIVDLDNAVSKTESFNEKISELSNSYTISNKI